jgi:hypothetical protein
MDGLAALYNALLMLVLFADLMMALSLLRMLPWRVSCAFCFVGSLLTSITATVMGDWTTAGTLAACTGAAGFLWWKRRNDDDDDDTKRRRRRAVAKVKSHLPKPKGFDRPMPVTNR